LVKDYRQEQQQWDLRFYRVIETQASAFGRTRSGLEPGVVFPSLKAVVREEPDEEEDPEKSYENIRAILQAAASPKQRSR
jgi:hypothetical protein